MKLNAIVTDAIAKPAMTWRSERIIVLDPGHGGHDKGARGAEGTFEKNITMRLARLIASELDRECKVVLTRTGDYRLEVFHRTALANQNKAAALISLHTGGSFLHKASGISVYYYEPSQALISPSSRPVDQAKENSALSAWDRIQTIHKTESVNLARSISNYIAGQPSFATSKVRAAPLLLLKGADMPAILIEIGYLTNPSEEHALRDPSQLSDFAKRISAGVIDFLNATDNR